MTESIKEAVHFFKSEPVYEKLFSAFAKKYQSLGRMSGTIPLNNYSKGELETIARFLGVRKDILFEKRKVSLREFQKQLAEYRFEGVELKELVEAFLDTRLISNREVREKQYLEKYTFIEENREKYSQLKEWLWYIQSHPKETRWIHQLIDQKRENFSSLLPLLNEVIKNIPDTPIRLPVFAHKYLGNPHALDRNQRLGRLFIHRLAMEKSFNEERSSVKIPNTSEEISELLLDFNLLRDDITNDITVVNILADSKLKEKAHVWKSASNAHSALNIPIRELLEVETLYPADEGNKVYVVENSGVFSSLLDEVPHIPLICTHGQFKLATWKCLDLFAPSTDFYYAGDMDPEGIGIANRLINRYGDQVKLWKMDLQSYEKAVSKDEMLTNRRVNQLKGLKNPILKEFKKKLYEVKSPAYQEALLDEMIEELKEEYK